MLKREYFREQIEKSGKNPFDITVFYAFLVEEEKYINEHNTEIKLRLLKLSEEDFPYYQLCPSYKNKVEYTKIPYIIPIS